MKKKKRNLIEIVQLIIDSKRALDIFFKSKRNLQTQNRSNYIPDKLYLHYSYQYDKHNHLYLIHHK